MLQKCKYRELNEQWLIQLFIDSSSIQSLFVKLIKYSCTEQESNLVARHFRIN